MVHVAILAGSKFRSYIKGEPKCFIDMPTGESIVEEILHQIRHIKAIESIVVVGPELGLEKLRSRNIKRFGKQIILQSQGKNQQENMVLAKQAVVKAFKIPKKKADDLGLLFLFGDTPFRKRHSVEEFIRQIDVKKDIVISVVHEERVLKYYSLFKKPMIPLYLDGAAGNFKETNMAYFNPDKIMGELATKFYGLRHTSRIKTMLELRKLALTMGGKEVLSILQRIFFVRQWHRTFRRFTPRWFNSPRPFYKKLDKDNLMKLIENITGIKMDVVVSSFPDGYIDLDKRVDYRRIYKNFFELNSEISTDCALAMIRHRK